MKRDKTMMALYAGCLAVMCACSEKHELSDGFIDEPKELGVNPTMTLAKGEARDAAATTTEFATNAEIAVLAAGSAGESNYGADNNYAVYKKSASSWDVQGDKHIYLTSEVATIYAVYPSTVVSEVPTEAVTANTEVEIATFPGAADGIDTSNESKNLITAAKDAIGSVNIAPGETDYMYAGGTPQPTASNGKGADAPSSSVNLSMQHALAMVSFRVYKKADYKGAGHLTKIQMKNKVTSSGGTPLKLQESESSKKTTMKISDGEVTLKGTPTDITYTRFIHQTRDDESDGTKYYVLKEAAGADASATAPAFGIMLYPIAWDSSATSDIQAVFTVDGTDYPVDIPAVAWAKGTNSIYSATLAGEGLSLGTVTIAGWTDTSISNGLNLIQKP